jgi:hypothetical protein
VAADVLVQEYGRCFGLKTGTFRCGVLAGPQQMGKVDQGVVTLWVARHHFRRPLRYTGFGGSGKQVRGILHIDDLCQLVLRQLARPEHWDGSVYNVGGGRERALSFVELTALCREATGNTVEIGTQPETSPVDVRIYVTDSRKVQADHDWSPQRTLVDVDSDTASWLEANEADLRGSSTEPGGVGGRVAAVRGHPRLQRGGEPGQHRLRPPRRARPRAGRLRAGAGQRQQHRSHRRGDAGARAPLPARPRRHPQTPRGFGRAVRSGLEAARGDTVVVCMADSSDDPADVLRYHRKLEEGYDCVFGSRFVKGSRVVHYPRGKLIANRIVNKCIQVLFRCPYNDLTNAFKAYRREVTSRLETLEARLEAVERELFEQRKQAAE